MSKSKSKTVKTDTAAGGPNTTDVSTEQPSDYTTESIESEITPDTVDLGPKTADSKKKTYVQKAIAEKRYP